MALDEFKAGGAGLQIHYGLHETSFGKVLIAMTTRGVCNLFFFDSKPEAEQILQRSWPQAELIHNPQATQAIHDRMFLIGTDSEQKPLALHVKGTDFQIQVWQALLHIPPGKTTTYQAIAETIGRPTAARAVGNAVGSNPVAYLIPCHRVIRESGELGGYRWGLTRKTAMLGWEASQVRGINVMTVFS